MINPRIIARKLGLRQRMAGLISRHAVFWQRLYPLAATAAALLVFSLLVLPAALLGRKSVARRFGASRSAGWKPCQIASWEKPVYADAYRVSCQPNDTMTATSRSGWRVLRCLCLLVRTTGKQDPHQPPTDTYAMF